MIHLNSRRTYMLKQLLEDNQPLKIDKLARKLECSQRTIRYDLDIVDAWLKKHNLDLLVRKHTDGIYYYYNRSIKEKILEQLSQLTIQEYEFNRKERVELICLVLLTTNKVTTISRLQDFFLMSRSSIILDLDQVEQELKHYSILLKRKPRKGVWVEGTEINIRQKLIQLHKSINQQTLQVFVNENGINNRTLKDMEFSPSLSGIIDELQFKKIRNLINPLLEVLSIHLSDESEKALYLHIGMVLKRLGKNRVVKLESNLLKSFSNSKEYQVAKLVKQQIEEAFQVTLPEEEVGYITLHLLSKQSAPCFSIEEKQFDEERLYQDILRMILQVERLMNVKFNSRQELAKGLFIHLKPAINRSKYGLIIENPLLEEIKSEFSELFIAISQALEEIEHLYRISFNDAEIAYVTMHFCSGLSNVSKKPQRLISILIICTSGIGTASLLRSRIVESFMNVNIVHTLSYSAFIEKEDWDVDLIVSTIKVRHTKIPFIQVSPLLSEQDKKRLSLFLEPKTDTKVPFTPQDIYERIWPIIHKYAEVHQSQKLTNELIDELHSLIDETRYHTPLDLKDIFNLDMIQLDLAANDWKDAIRLAAQPLEKTLLVDQTYKERIINILEKRGPYMAVAPGIMFAHAETLEENVLGLSLTRLAPGIHFGHETNDPIILLFMFVASKDSQKVNVLNELLELLLKKDVREVLLTAKAKGDIISTLFNEEQKN